MEVVIMLLIDLLSNKVLIQCRRLGAILFFIKFGHCTGNRFSESVGMPACEGRERNGAVSDRDEEVCARAVVRRCHWT